MLSEGPQEDVHRHSEQPSVSCNKQCADDVDLSNAGRLFCPTDFCNVLFITGRFY